DKAYNALLSTINDHVPARKGDGSKRTKAEKQAYLREQVNRLPFDFVTKNGQHQISSNRVEYGTGGTGAGVFKRAKGAKQSTRKPAKAQKRSQSRTKPAAKTRGPPKGSHNRKWRGMKAKVGRCEIPTPSHAFLRREDFNEVHD